MSWQDGVRIIAENLRYNSWDAPSSSCEVAMDDAAAILERLADDGVRDGMLHMTGHPHDCWCPGCEATRARAVAYDVYRERVASGDGHPMEDAESDTLPARMAAAETMIDEMGRKR